MTPTRRLLFLVVATLPVAAAPVLVDPTLWLGVLALWAALLVALALDALTLALARPAVRVQVAGSVGVGTDLPVKIEVNLRGLRPLPGTLRAEVDLPLRAGPDVDARLLPGDNTVHAALTAERRGVGRLQAAWLRLRGPTGLLDRIDRFSLDGAEITVVPDVARVRRALLRYFGGSRLQGGIKLRHAGGEGGEFDNLDGYVPGMDLRQADWKASARHQALRIRRFRPERNQRVVLCLDTGRLMADPIPEAGSDGPGLPRLDHGIHAALTLAWAALREGDLVGLYAYSDEPGMWLPPAQGMRHLRRLITGCSALQVLDEETNHVRGLHDLLVRLSRRSLVVVMTDFTDSTTAELMIERLAPLARRHLVVFVALDDPVIEQPLSAEPNSVEDLASAVVAGKIANDRDRVLRRIAHMGIDVVQGPPGQATLGLLAAYVKAKRRGRIG